MASKLQRPSLESALDLLALGNWEKNTELLWAEGCLPGPRPHVNAADAVKWRLMVQCPLLSHRMHHSKAFCPLLWRWQDWKHLMNCSLKTRALIWLTEWLKKLTQIEGSVGPGYTGRSECERHLWSFLKHQHGRHNSRPMTWLSLFS